MKPTGREQRLFVEHDLRAGQLIPCGAAQRNYLVNVLRLGDGDTVLVFNGRDGEWLAVVRPSGKKVCALEIGRSIREQADGPDIALAFAPLKRGRLDYMVQKATELGVSALHPVFTAFTQADRINLERMRANVIEAAEQCGVLRVPTVNEPQKLERVLENWPSDRVLIFCDEAAAIEDPVAALGAVSLPATILVGPEGGFSPGERQKLAQMSPAVTLSLGPRIMRADTAAVAALALINATIGDWQ
ncbi:MAG: 16S rRNA (uracil(1498)-N(3))-methyltransferase [Hyphomicrobiaceae bacterium]